MLHFEYDHHAEIGALLDRERMGFQFVDSFLVLQRHGYRVSTFDLNYG